MGMAVRKGDRVDDRNFYLYIFHTNKCVDFN